MDDLISRKAAIDAIGKVSDELYENIKKGATFPQRQWFDGMAQAQSILEDLPPAQPEIIRCNDCKYRPTATRADEGITYGFSVEFPDGMCPCQCPDGWYNWYPKDDFYCGWAERRADE